MYVEVICRKRVAILGGCLNKVIACQAREGTDVHSGESKDFEIGFIRHGMSPPLQRYVHYHYIMGFIPRWQTVAHLTGLKPVALLEALRTGGLIEP